MQNNFILNAILMLYMLNLISATVLLKVRIGKDGINKHTIESWKK